jgi:hypothetical protein
MLQISAASFNAAYVCSGCVLISGLIEESSEYQLIDYFNNQCASTKTPELCNTATKVFLEKLLAKVKPEILCDSIGACPQGCNLFSEWPLKPEIHLEVEEAQIYYDSISLIH